MTVIHEGFSIAGMKASGQASSEAAGGRRLCPAAERALAEAAERRAARERAGSTKETPTRQLDPTRYGDWEHKGLASDF